MFKDTFEVINLWIIYVNERDFHDFTISNDYLSVCVCGFDGSWI